MSDFEGKGLADAEISILGTTTRAGEDVAFFPRTAADGTYSLEVPEGNYRVSASYDLTFESKRYRFELHPSDGKRGVSYPSSAGIVRDFTLKVSGFRPDGERNASEGWAYYGGEVGLTIADVYSESFQTNHFATEFPQGFTAEVTFTPQGPLADGSTGQPVVSTASIQSMYDADWEQLDLPVGKYLVTGKAKKPDGTTRPLKVVGSGPSWKLSNHAPADSAVLLIEPDDGVTGGTEKMAVRFAYGTPYPPVP